MKNNIVVNQMDSFEYAQELFGIKHKLLPKNRRELSEVGYLTDDGRCYLAHSGDDCKTLGSFMAVVDGNKIERITFSFKLNISCSIYDVTKKQLHNAIMPFLAAMQHVFNLKEFSKPVFLSSDLYAVVDESSESTIQDFYEICAAYVISAKDEQDRVFQLAVLNGTDDHDAPEIGINLVVLGCEGDKE